MIYQFFNEHLWLVYGMVFTALVILPWLLFHIQNKEQQEQNRAQAEKIYKYVIFLWVLIMILGYLFNKK